MGETAGPIARNPARARCGGREQVAPYQRVMRIAGGEGVRRSGHRPLILASRNGCSPRPASLGRYASVCSSTQLCSWQRAFERAGSERACTTAYWLELKATLEPVTAR